MSELFKSLVERAKAVEAESPDALVAVFDEQGYYRYVSRRHPEVMGYSREEMTGMHWTEVIDDAYVTAAHVIRAVASLHENEPVEQHFHLRTKSGATVPIKGTVTIVHQGKETYLMTINRVTPSQRD